MEPEVALGNLTFAGREGFGPIGNTSNLTVDQLLAMLNPENYPRSYVNERLTRHSVIIAFYSTIVLVSLFGNLFVCYVITKRRRMRTRTNFLMTNMAVSDLVMTCLNIPFNIARILLNTWPFGSALCIFVPFVQVTSVYVSTFTMTIIAIDRYQAIINPLHKRLSTSVPISVIILFIWLTAGIFAIPNVAFNRVVQLPLTKLSRCRTVYPANELTIRRFITLFTFLSQYAIPLSITAFAYIRISFYVWHKLTEPTESCSSASTFSTEKMNGQQEYMEQSLASVPHSQLGSLKRTCYYQANVIQLRDRSRRKTIKMLSLVVACFAISWLPLNVFHLNSDFRSSNEQIPDPTIFWVCHWLAYSSVCYNPILYFALNRTYQQEATDFLRLTRCTHICCYREEDLEEPSQPEPFQRRKLWLKNGAPFEDTREWAQDKNNNSRNSRLCNGHAAAGGKVAAHSNARVRYSNSEKPANCKIIFRSRYNNVPLVPTCSSSSSGGNSSGGGGSVKQSKCKLHRSNAVRMSSNHNHSMEASSNRSNVYNSVASSRSERGSDI